MGLFDTNSKHSQRKKYKKIERENRRKEKKRLTAIKNKRRKGIRQHKWREFKKSFVAFIKKPFSRKTISSSERIRKEAFKEARNRMVIEWFVGFPARLKKTISYTFNKKRFQWEFIHARSMEFRDNTKLLFSTPILRNNLKTLFIQSIGAFTLSLILLIILNNMTSIFVASFFDIPAQLFQSKIYWPLSTYSSLYHRNSLIFIFGSGPFVMILISLLLFFFYIKKPKGSHFIKFFALWSFINATTLFFGAYTIGVITRTGFVYASEWLFMTSGVNKLEIIFVSIASIITVLLGSMIQKVFLSISFSSDSITKKFRLWYLLMTAIFPWLIGGMLIIIFGIPNLMIEYILIPAFVGLMVLPVLLGYKNPKLDDLRVKNIRIRKNSNIIVVSLVITISITIFLVLRNGILFNA